MPLAAISGSEDTNDDNLKNIIGYDENGNEIDGEFDPETGEVTFARTPTKITYEYDTEFEDVNMDVELSGTSNEDDDEELTSSAGGCTTGFASGALLLVLSVFAFPSKKH